MTQIADIRQLAEILGVSFNSLRRYWKAYPHFFVGDGRDCRGARFDVADVILYLKAQGGNYGRIQDPENGEMGVQIQVSEKDLQDGRVFIPVPSYTSGGPGQGAGGSTADKDPHHLVS